MVGEKSCNLLEQWEDLPQEKGSEPSEPVQINIEPSIQGRQQGKDNTPAYLFL